MGRNQDPDPHDPIAHAEASADVAPHDQMLTESDAEVTVADAMDENRVEEVLDCLGHHWSTVRAELDGAELEENPPEGVERWSDVRDRLVEAEATVADTVDTLVSRAERPYPSLLRLRVDPAEEIAFVPGHYIRISFGDYPPRVYSIASSPNREHLEFAVRRVPGGELTPHLCQEVAPGDELFVRGPYGDDFGLTEPTDRDLVFVATGTGVAPFWSMINYVFEEGWDETDGGRRDVYLVLGSSWEDDLAYHGEWRRMDAERENFHYVPTLSQESKLTDWEGESDYVQQVFLRCLDSDKVDVETLPERLRRYADETLTSGEAPNLDPESVELFVCGIGVMANQVEEVARSAGIDERFRHVESYG